MLPLVENLNRGMTDRLVASSRHDVVVVGVKLLGVRLTLIGQKIEIPWEGRTRVLPD